MTRVIDGGVEYEVWPHLSGSLDDFDVLSSGTNAGTVLGATRAGKPINVQLLRPAPVRIVTTHAWLASLLALRAAVLGANVVIATERPAPWSVLVRAAGGQTPFATVAHPGSAVPAASVAEPLFVLHDDLGAAAVTDAQTARSAWHTSVNLMPSLTPDAGPLLDAAELILVPRPSDEQIDPTLELLRLPPAMASKIVAMQGTEVLAVTRSRALFVTMQISPTERQVISGA